MLLNQIYVLRPRKKWSMDNTELFTQRRNHLQTFSSLYFYQNSKLCKLKKMNTKNKRGFAKRIKGDMLKEYWLQERITNNNESNCVTDQEAIYRIHHSAGGFLDLVAIEHFLFLSRTVLRCKNNFPWFVVLECLMDWCLVQPHLLFFLNNHCVRILISRHKLLCIVHLPTQNMEIPDECASSLSLVNKAIFRISIFLF